jgi:hypothetical protein
MKTAIVELDGTEYVFSSSQQASAFVTALEAAEGHTKASYRKERKPLVEDIKVSMRLATRDDHFVEPCQRCFSTWTAPEDGEEYCESCAEELRKEDYPCSGTIPETDGEEAHTCTNTVNLLPEKAEDIGLNNILCYSCRKREEDSE